jgi:hypothetical protein
MQMAAWAQRELQQVAARCEAVGYRRADTLAEERGCYLAVAGQKAGAEQVGWEETTWSAVLLVSGIAPKPKLSVEGKGLRV